MKAGTTTLYRYLCEHPELAACEQKEPGFFAGKQNWHRGLDWYDSLWDWQPDHHSWALEGSTHYTKIPEFPNAARRIASLDRDFKFIYLVRDPIDRIESHLTHGLAEGWLDERKPIDEHWDALNFSRYAKQLRPYEAEFPESDMLVVTFEELVKRPRQLLGKVYEHLAIPQIELDNYGEFNTSEERIGGKWYSAVLNPLKELDVVKDTAESVGYPLDKVKLDEEEKSWVRNHLWDDWCHLRDEYDIAIQRWLR
jgi:hypothetical protein